MTPYEPPRQSLRGQLVDAVFILVLLFATLFVSTAAPHRLVKIAPTGTPIELVLAK